MTQVVWFLPVPAFGVVALWLLAAGMLWGMTKAEARTKKFLVLQLVLAPLFLPLVFGISIGTAMCTTEETTERR